MSTLNVIAAFLLAGGMSVSVSAFAAQPNQSVPPPPPALPKPASVSPGSAAAPVPVVPPKPGAGASSGVPAVTEPILPIGRGGYVYLPEGRRDPFLSILDMAKANVNAGPLPENLPPLQRFNVAELTVVGIVWGGFGYTAMIQAPDGRGYTVQRGTKIGTSNGVVTAVTEKAVIVEERFTDIFGKKQVREYAKPLHIKEGTE